MTTWIRRIRAALAIGLTWGLAWGFIGGMIELLSNLAPGLQWPYAVDMWPQTLAIPGFLCGAVFGLVLTFAGGRRRFDDLSVPGFAALGAVAGGALGLVTGAPLFILFPLTLMSAASAASTLAVAKAATITAAAPSAGAAPAIADRRAVPPALAPPSRRS